jgi:carboxymethylenebutenolidase
VLVVHENRGLHPHIEDGTRCLALDRAREAFAKLDQAKTREAFVAAASVLKLPGQSRPSHRGYRSKNVPGSQ